MLNCLVIFYSIAFNANSTNLTNYSVTLNIRSIDRTSVRSTACRWGILKRVPEV